MTVDPRTVWRVRERLRTLHSVSAALSDDALEAVIEAVHAAERFDVHDALSAAHERGVAEGYEAGEELGRRAAAADLETSHGAAKALALMVDAGTLEQRCGPQGEPYWQAADGAAAYKAQRDADEPKAAG